jgi:HK97 family phage prohead protease
VQFAPATILLPLIGYAARFNQPSVSLANGRRLQFDSCAFDEFLACSPQERFAVMNHEGVSMKFASWTKGSLLLDADDHGLFVFALPRNDSSGRIASGLIAGGHARHMSVGVSYAATDIRPRGTIDIVSRASIREVSGTDIPAMPGTELRTCTAGGTPRTIEQLISEENRLRELNLLHARQDSLAEWKRQKAFERAALLRSLNQNQLATAS